MAHAKNHDYHILNPSVWPLLGAIGGFVMLFGAVLWMKEVTAADIRVPVGIHDRPADGLLRHVRWWAEVVEESQVGDHTPVVRIGLRYGFICSSCPR